MMRWRFGNAFTRLVWGGVRLRDSERKLLELAVDELPEDVRRTVDAQLCAYNLAQRESDGRAINFYRKAGKQPNDMADVALLPMRVNDAPLVKITAKFEAAPEPVHAVLTAVGNRVFCISFSRKLTSQDDASPVAVLRSVASWRSNVPAGVSQ
jgi:hypothetical protein